MAEQTCSTNSSAYAAIKGALIGQCDRRIECDEHSEVAMRDQPRCRLRLVDAESNSEPLEQRRHDTRFHVSVPMRIVTASILAGTP
jgi:hypothetical protein